jgi:hypothetical protein
MVVEGKVDEPFGPLVKDWLPEASDHEHARSGHKHARLERLARTLGIDPSACRDLRYQLVHRTASAVYEAHRYRAKTAVMMVHSFDPHHAGLDDFKRFAAELLLPDADAARMAGPIERECVDLYLGWAPDHASSG